MKFKKGDIVRKIGKMQKYKIVDVLPDIMKYGCVFEPPMGPGIKLYFKEADLELAV